MESAGSVAFRRSIGRGWSFLRHSRGWRLDAVGVAASLASLQLLLGVSAGARMTGDDVLRAGSVRLEIAEGTLDQRVQELYAGLKALPSAADVQFVTAEGMLQDEAARDPSLGTFLERYGIDNPFADTLVVTPHDGALYDELRAFVQAEDARGGVDQSALAEIAARETAARDSLGVASAASAGAGILAALAGASAVVLSWNLARRLSFARAPSALVETLAGAAPVVVSAPSVAASALALFLALSASVFLAAASVLLVASSFSAAPVGAWIARAAVEGAVPAAPLALFVEAAALFAVARVAGRADPSSRA